MKNDARSTDSSTVEVIINDDDGKVLFRVPEAHWPIKRALSLSFEEPAPAELEVAKKLASKLDLNVKSFRFWPHGFKTMWLVESLTPNAVISSIEYALKESFGVEHFKVRHVHQ